MSKYFIGIMTGTSADALDGCIVSFEKEFSLKGSHTIDLGKYYAILPENNFCLLYTSPSPRDRTRSRMPSSA